LKIDAQEALAELPGINQLCHYEPILAALAFQSDGKTAGEKKKTDQTNDAITAEEMATAMRESLAGWSQAMF
jgi:hypothetical protein